jgi:hypothetical protein
MADARNDSESEADEKLARELVRGEGLLIPHTPEDVARFEAELARRPVTVPSHLRDPAWLLTHSPESETPSPAAHPALRRWLERGAFGAGGAALAFLIAYLAGWPAPRGSSVTPPETVVVHEVWQAMPPFEPLPPSGAHAMPPVERDLLLTPPDDGAPSGPESEKL